MCFWQTGPDRPLPERQPPKEPLKYGFPIPEAIPEGKANLKDIMDFIAEYQSDPKNYTANDIAKKYKLDSVKVKQVLANYRMFKKLDFRDHKQKEKEHWITKESTESTLSSIPTLKKTRGDFARDRRFFGWR